MHPKLNHFNNSLARKRGACKRGGKNPGSPPHYYAICDDAALWNRSFFSLMPHDANKIRLFFHIGHRLRYHRRTGAERRKDGAALFR